jgi:hypothetical protein
MDGRRNRWKLPRCVGGYAPGRKKAGGIWLPDDAADILKAVVKVNFDNMRSAFIDEGFDFAKDKLVIGELSAVESEIKEKLSGLVGEIHEKQRHIFLIKDALYKLDGIILECIDFMHFQFGKFGIADDSRAHGIISRAERNIITASQEIVKKWK